MTKMVRKEDVERMIKEAFQQGADDFQLIPNLLNSLRLFMPTFDVTLDQDSIRKAHSEAQANLAKHRGY